MRPIAIPSHVKEGEEWITPQGTPGFLRWFSNAYIHPSRCEATHTHTQSNCKAHTHTRRALYREYTHYSSQTNKHRIIHPLMLEINELKNQRAKGWFECSPFFRWRSSFYRIVRPGAPQCSSNPRKTIGFNLQALGSSTRTAGGFFLTSFLWSTFERYIRVERKQPLYIYFKPWTMD